MYDMQIASYDANLSFFMDKITIYVIIQHVRFYDSRSDPTIHDLILRFTTPPYLP